MSRTPTPMVTLGDPERVRQWCDDRRRSGARIGFVPTMGYLHEGHLSLVRLACAVSDAVVVSLFVNPLQFGPNEDLSRYPSDLEGDSRRCASEGVGLLFAPTSAQMYPHGMATTVQVPVLSRGLCGRERPGHFEGVCAVVARLFNIVGPCTVVFGEKDYQQLVIIRRMAADLAFPVRILAGPTVRETDGLAMSSRNAYLSAAERRAATVLPRALERLRQRAIQGPLSAGEAEQLVSRTIGEEPSVRLQYVELVDALTLEPVATTGVGGEAVVAAAVQVGGTRLIDNVRIQ